MPKLEFSTEEVEALRYWRFHHPHPHVQRKMEVIYLRSQKLENKQIQHLCGISKASNLSLPARVSSGGSGETSGVELSPPAKPASRT
jgi:hypothetical protein